MLENLSAHKAPAVAKWLAHPRTKRWHLHYTPHLLLLAQPGRGGGSNSSPTGGSTEEPSPVSMLSSRPLQCEPSARTTTPNPSLWHKTTDDTITKVHRDQTAPTHQTKSATHH